ncbi:MAG: AAA family ATPase [Gammaproteobacteria bacterium]|nr:AAA family ATPase [Gammaproteobacteria bacterium]MDH3804790.1 AAA family ATPase [Gammaproteobacteria bacterium]
MYETHFGLKKRPFRAHAVGTDVFVGPQTAATIAGLKKALATPDSIVAVSGPVGVGKTTLVRRALEAVGDKQVIISVGRMQLGHDEVLELLLEEMGAQLPAGTVQRFTTFRRLLKEHAEKGSRIIVVVEDATRIGTDALSELEALTAADAGVSDGANIVLMGDQELNDILKTPRLARLKQRLRSRQAITPLSAKELTGYFKHCFRLAGNEYDTMFAEGASDVLHALSGGIPRIANNLVESTLTAAAESKADQVTLDLINRVASDEYGLEVDAVAPVKVPEAVAPEAGEVEEPRVGERRVAERRVAQPETPAIQAAKIRAEEPKAEEPEAAPVEPRPLPELAESPVAEASPEAIEATADEDDDDVEIPELIQDTLPDLAILAPALANVPDPEDPQEPDSPEIAEISEAPAHEIPTLSSAVRLETPGAEAPEPAPEPEPQPEPVQEPNAELAAALEAAQVPPAEGEIPEWERDPTLAQLRPDLDALEHAMAVAQGLAPATDDDPEPDTGPREPDEPVPEITLDRAIQKKIDEATALAREAELEAAEQAEPEQKKSAASVDETPEPVAKDDTKPAPKSIQAQFAVADIPVPPVAKPPAQPVVDAAVEPPVLPVLKAAAAPPAPPVVATPPAPPVAAAASKAPVAPRVEAPVKPAGKANPQNGEFGQIAENIARAKTIDDVDDKMAETLFGEEFSLMAAEVAANAPPELSANDEHELALEDSVKVPVADVESPAPADIKPKTEVKLQGGNPDLAATQQRLATIRALNAGAEPAPPKADHIVMPAKQPAPAPRPPDGQPESIEDQINTSITQTLKALNVRPPPTANDHADDDDDEEKSGFFSRFRRS